MMRKKIEELDRINLEAIEPEAVQKEEILPGEE